jgi:hypothetical protein
MDGYEYLPRYTRWIASREPEIALPAWPNCRALKDR